MLHFLNKFDFVGYLENDEYEKSSCIRKVLTIEFQYIDSENSIDMLGVIDDLYILFITQNFHDIHLLDNIVRSDISLLVKEKSGR